MPAGDAGLEWVRKRLDMAHLRIDDVLPDRDAAPFHEILDNAQRLTDQIDRLQAQLADVQAQLVARGPYCALHGEHQPCSQHRWVGAAQAAQPEGESR